MTMPSSANSSESAASRCESNEGGYLPRTSVRASPQSPPQMLQG
jgi:hypothetical protein